MARIKELRILTLLLQCETLVQEMKYLALDFCCFSGIMLCRNLEFFHILRSGNH